MKHHRALAVLLSTLAFAMPAAADDPVKELTQLFCVKCHRGDTPKGDLRLDQSVSSVLDDSDRLESIISVLASKEMPPSKSNQPSDKLRASAIAYLKVKLSEHEPQSRLKRLTRDEYTNTINDLFDADFDLKGLLPPDPPGDGFNKWGETQPMSPYQVASYLRAARFVADRLILDERPKQHSWEFGIKNFVGTGRGDFQTETEHALTTHYPWRSILYFVGTDKQKKIFRVPEYGRYRVQADVKVHHSKQAETISLSIGDPRYPTNIEKFVRAVLQPDADSISIDTTLRALTYLSFTYDSAATWNTGNKRDEYKGRQVRFTRVRITGPVTETWPTIAQNQIFDGQRFRSLTSSDTRAFTEHLIGLLLNRSIPQADVIALTQLTKQRLNDTGNPNAAARTLLTALLSSPHFIYKSETDSLDGIAFAHRLSYFLWNSIPDSQLLALARSGELNSTDVLTNEVERMLADSRSDRLCDDFTRQWLSTGKIDDIGPDDRVHNTKRVTFVRVRELAKEPAALFRELLHHDLSMINFIDSDFAMVNDETSAFYGYKPVHGRSFQRVDIPKDSERGGLIGQAGLLKLTSGKHSTSPILRGTWVLKNIYCEKLNPPPGVAAAEPDTRGAKTVKEILEHHKKVETCNRCHARIDPLGLALEHYDEMGLRRKQYTIVETQVGNKTIKKRNAPIDSKAVLPDGQTISSLTELKSVLMDDRDKILKGILSKLASYALGREIGVNDESMIDEIYRRIAKEDYSLRAAIHAIVAHESFRTR